MNRIQMSKQVVFPKSVPEGRKLGKLRGMDVYIEGTVGEDDLFVVVYRPNPCGSSNKKQSVISELFLSNDYCPGAYHVDSMQIDHRFQGHGIATLLYRYLIKKLGIILQAGTLQSPGGRKIWAQLAKESGIQIFAAYRRGKQLIQIESDDDSDELFHETVKLYDGVRQVYTFAMAV